MASVILNETISGLQRITPSLPPNFDNFAYPSPIVRETISLPGRILTIASSELYNY